MPNVCRKCHAPVRWAITAKGKRMILDAEPIATGEWTVDEFGGLHRRERQGSLDEAMEGVPHGHTGPYVTHFATCPYADELRKR